MRFFLSHFWRTISLALTLFGIFWLPKDIQDYGEAARSWQTLSILWNREVAVWGFAILALCWLFWSELKPALKEFRLPFWGRQSYNGLFGAKLVFEIDASTMRLRRLENVGVFRFFTMPNGAGQMLLFLAFERDTSTEILNVSANDGSKAHYDVLDASPRSLVLRFHHAFTMRGYTIECLLPIDATKPQTSLYTNSDKTMMFPEVNDETEKLPRR